MLWLKLFHFHVIFILWLKIYSWKFSFTMHDAFLCEVCICKYFVRMLNFGGIKFTNISENKVLLNNEPKAHWEAYNIGWRPSSVIVISFKHLLRNHWANQSKRSCRQFVRLNLVTWPSWLPCPYTYMVKFLKILFFGIDWQYLVHELS